MSPTIHKVHKTIFEKKPAKEIADISILQQLANSEEYGKDTKQNLRFSKYIAKSLPLGYLDVSWVSNDHNLGRLQAELSIGNEWGIIRSAVCSMYWDIDGVNMGYQIFYQAYKLLTKGEKRIPELSSVNAYITNRKFYTDMVYNEYFTAWDEENPEIKYAIKQLFIRILNGGSISKWKRDFHVNSKSKNLSFLGLLEKDIKAATKLLFDYLPAEFKKQSNSNPEKDTLSHFIYETEKKCVEQVLIAAGCPETYIYCKDGIMLLKSEFTKDMIEDIITIAQNNITAIYGLTIEFKEKPIIQEINLDELTPKEDAASGYEYEKERFEQKYCKIKDLILFPFKSANGEIKFHTEKQMIGAERDFCKKVLRLVKNDKGEDIVRQMRFIDEWLDDSDKKKYDDMNIYPSDIAHTCPDNIYNLWTPFLAESYEPCPEDDCIDELEFLLNHILVLCNHEKEIYNYFIRWFGQMLKFPSVKTTAPTFISEEGAGKGSLFELFRRVLGEKKVLETTNPEKVVGKFNILILNAFLVIFNELEQHKIKQYGGDIKAFITDKSIQVEGKGTNAFQSLSFHRLLNATNGLTGGALNPHKHDRRNVIVRCSDELCNNVEYFTKFYACIDNTKVIRKFYDYCYNLDGLSPLIAPPRTAHHKILIDGNVCKVKEFIKECVFNWAAQGIEEAQIPPITLYNNFKEYIDANGFKYETNTVHLVRKIGLLNIPNSKGKAKGSRYISLNIEELIKYFNLKRNEENKLIVEEVDADEDDKPLERLEQIILDRPTEHKLHDRHSDLSIDDLDLLLL